jgi:hypothetical protein
MHKLTAIIQDDTERKQIEEYAAEHSADVVAWWQCPTGDFASTVQSLQTLDDEAFIVASVAVVGIDALIELFEYVASNTTEVVYCVDIAGRPMRKKDIADLCGRTLGAPAVVIHNNGLINNGCIEGVDSVRVAPKTGVALEERGD